MARVPTLTRRITPSGRVAGVTIPSDIADTGQGIEAQGLQFLGRSITDIGNLLAELSERERKADDLLASDSAGIARQSAADGYLQFKEDNKDPKLWGEAAKRSRDDADAAFEKLKFFDPQRKERERLRHIAEMNHFEVIAQLQITDAKSKIAVTATTDSFVSAFANNSSDLVAKEADLDEALLNEFGGELALVRKKEILALAQKQQIENIKKDIMNRAAVRPELMKSFIDAELKARKTGKKALDEFALLSNSELESIRDYASSVGEKAVSDSEIAVNAAIVDAYSKIRNGGTDIDTMIDAIDADPTISDKDKLLAAEKIPTYFNKINSIKVADESNEDVYDELTRASESVERGTMSPAIFEELYADKKQFLDKADQRAIRSKDIVATKTMQNRAFTDAMSATLPTLVELTESDLGAIKLARQNAEIIKDIASVNLFNIAIKKNQAERWNYGRFRKQLRTQIDQNPEWSQKQIYVAQEILVGQLDMPVDQLLKEFDDQNPDRAIMKTPPSIDFKDIWLDLSIDDKAKIWELTMRGAPSEVILEAIKK